MVQFNQGPQQYTTYVRSQPIYLHSSWYSQIRHLTWNSTEFLCVSVDKRVLSLVWRIVPPEASTCTGQQHKNADVFPFRIKHSNSLSETLGIPRLRGYVVLIGYSTVITEHLIFSIPSLRRSC